MFKKINIAKRSKEKFYHLIILHKGVIINDILGRNRILQGKAEIGNNSVGAHDTMLLPRLGDGVDIGVGAVIIGEVTIAYNVKIGANSVVTKKVFMKKILFMQ